MASLSSLNGLERLLQLGAAASSESERLAAVAAATAPPPPAADAADPSSSAPAAQAAAAAAAGAGGSAEERNATIKNLLTGLDPAAALTLIGLGLLGGAPSTTGGAPSPAAPAAAASPALRGEKRRLQAVRLSDSAEEHEADEGEEGGEGSQGGGPAASGDADGAPAKRKRPNKGPKKEAPPLGPRRYVCSQITMDVLEREVGVCFRFGGVLCVLVGGCVGLPDHRARAGVQGWVALGGYLPGCLWANQVDARRRCLLARRRSYEHARSDCTALPHLPARCSIGLLRHD